MVFVASKKKYAPLQPFRRTLYLATKAIGDAAVLGKISVSACALKIQGIVDHCVVGGRLLQLPPGLHICGTVFGEPFVGNTLLMRSHSSLAVSKVQRSLWPTLSDVRKADSCVVGSVVGEIPVSCRIYVALLSVPSLVRGCRNLQIWHAVKYSNY